MEKTEITLEYLPEDTAFEPEGRAPLPFGKAILPKKAAVERYALIVSARFFDWT